MARQPTTSPLRTRRSDEHMLLLVSGRESTRIVQTSASTSNGSGLGHSSSLFAGYGQISAGGYAAPTTNLVHIGDAANFASGLPQHIDPMAAPQYVQPITAPTYGQTVLGSQHGYPVAPMSAGESSALPQNRSSRPSVSPLEWESYYFPGFDRSFPSSHSEHYFSATHPRSSLPRALYETPALATALNSFTAAPDQWMLPASPLSSAPSSDTTVPAASPDSTASGFPITCRVIQPGGAICGHTILLQPGSDNERSNGLRAHIREHHFAYIPCGKVKVNCPWDGCVCKCRKTPGTHVAHVEDVPLHIWNTHLNFAWPCNKCKTAQWGSSFALERHRKKCRGLDPARCALCFVEFPSSALFQLHLGPGGCVHD